VVLPKNIEIFMLQTGMLETQQVWARLGGGDGPVGPIM
jgi:hypothetical protein